MKQVYLLPFFLCVVSGAGALESAAACNAPADPAPRFVPGLVVGAQDTIIVGQDTTKESYVREDDPKVKKKKAPAAKTSRVIMKREVQRASLSRQSAEGNLVDVIVMQSGRVLRNLDDLQLVGSSGNHISSGNFVGFENIVTPFEGTVRFKATNPMGTATYDREVRFTVLEKGRWVLKIDL